MTSRGLSKENNSFEIHFRFYEKHNIQLYVDVVLFSISYVFIESRILLIENSFFGKNLFLSVFD